MTIRDLLDSLRGFSADAPIKINMFYPFDFEDIESIDCVPDEEDGSDICIINLKRKAAYEYQRRSLPRGAREG